MNLFDDLNIEDFLVISNTSFKHSDWISGFNLNQYGFILTDNRNMTYFKNLFGDIRYYLRKSHFNKKWIFKILNKDNKILHSDTILDNDTNNYMVKYMRVDKIKSFLDNLD